MKNSIFDWLCYTTTGASLTLFLETTKTVLIIISSLIAILTGIISIYLKLKNASADGVITEDEKTEIQSDVDDLKNKIKGINKNDKI